MNTNEPRDRKAMHIKSCIIRANEFVRSKPSGSLDFETTRALLRQIIMAADCATTGEILLDLRQISSVTLTLDEVSALAGDLKDFSPMPSRKIAVLLPPDAPGTRAAKFQARANEDGFSVEAFKDFEHAIYWLSTVEEVASKDLA